MLPVNVSILTLMITRSRCSFSTVVDIKSNELTPLDHITDKRHTLFTLSSTCRGVGRRK